MTIVTFNIMIL